MPQPEGAAILIAGGAEDRELAHLAGRAAARRIATVRLLADAPSPPDFRFNPATREATLDGAPLAVSGAFLRQDVFRQLRTGAPADAAAARAWKVALDGWLWARADIRAFNRGFLMRDEVSKPLALAWAAECGLAIPRTEIAASPERAAELARAGGWVFKPVNGGDLCRPLDGVAAETLRAPVVLQERLVAPEVRIFRVGARFFAFEVVSQALDYRDAAAPRPRLRPVPPPKPLLAPLTALLDRLGLDYSAADFKRRPENGRLTFLEANSNPMFSGFDQAARGALADAMLDGLTGTP